MLANHGDETFLFPGPVQAQNRGQTVQNAAQSDQLLVIRTVRIQCVDHAGEHARQMCDLGVLAACHRHALRAPDVTGDHRVQMLLFLLFVRQEFVVQEAHHLFEADAGSGLGRRPSSSARFLSCAVSCSIAACSRST